ncbi:hypothetical protein [Oenococcus oeni]|uniref:Uncharacterized protein n=2 Tax=Oenococcus oeni TaxID=1247 RepID=Q04GJ3_OENOB|nr:hypothetical protein [Oenococcus oeni]ABJ56429.1 hypothetical protein OEOE_0474 [Oenococcus oeni PSU-1]
MLLTDRMIGLNKRAWNQKFYVFFADIYDEILSDRRYRLSDMLVLMIDATKIFIQLNQKVKDRTNVFS